MVMTMIPNPMNADNYTTLWKQADEALEKDLPKTEQQWLGQIMEKARSEKAYGQLLKAELRMSKSLMAVSPDSLLPAVNRLREAEVNARRDEPVLSMVYAAVLGHLYKSYEELGDDHEAISADYFVRSLAQPELLAKYKALDYAPLVVEGKDSRIFYNDLLSVIGFEAGNMELLHSYYEKNGNRPASLITALEILKKKVWRPAGMWRGGHRPIQHDGTMRDYPRRAHALHRQRTGKMGLMATHEPTAQRPDESHPAIILCPARQHGESAQPSTQTGVQHGEKHR